MTDVLKENDVFVSEFRDALQEGKAGLKYVPQFLKRILKEERWRRRMVHQTGMVAEYENFADFITDLPPEGLGADVALLKRLCLDDPEALNLLDGAMAGESDICPVCGVGMQATHAPWCAFGDGTPVPADQVEARKALHECNVAIAKMVEAAPNRKVLIRMLSELAVNINQMIGEVTTIIYDIAVGRPGEL